MPGVGPAVLLAAPPASPDAEAELARLRDLAHEVRLGPSTAAIVAAAARPGHPGPPANRAASSSSATASAQRRIWTAETDRTGAIAEAIAQDKDLTRTLLQAVGVPVPDGRPVADAEDAWAAAEEIGAPVVVKPQDGNQGRGVATNLTTREQVAGRLSRRPRRGRAASSSSGSSPATTTACWSSATGSSPPPGASRRRSSATAARRSRSWSTRSTATRAAATATPPP